MTLKEADMILKEVKKAGVTYMSAHNQLFMPVVQETKKLIDSGALGKVRWLRSQDCFSAGRSREQWGWRASLKTQGGGELIDTGYHPTYRLLYLAGAPAQAIRASFGRFNCLIDGEDTASVTVRFANGAIGEILTSWAFSLPYGSPQIQVIGEKGEAWGSGNELFYRPEGYAAPARKQLQGGDTFADEIGHFADCLREGKRPIHGPEEGKAVLELILKAAASAKGWEETAQLKV
jgi:predicted dehydrogenase